MCQAHSATRLQAGRGDRRAGQGPGAASAARDAREQRRAAGAGKAQSRTGPGRASDQQQGGGQHDQLMLDHVEGEASARPPRGAARRWPRRASPSRRRRAGRRASTRRGRGPSAATAARSRSRRARPKSEQGHGDRKLGRQASCSPPCARAGAGMRAGEGAPAASSEAARDDQAPPRSDRRSRRRAAPAVSIPTRATNGVPASSAARRSQTRCERSRRSGAAPARAGR